MSWLSPRFDAVLAVLRGAARSDDELAAWIENRFGVDVVETTLDREHRRERLTVWVRTAEQLAPFTDATGNWDREAQAAIAARVGRDLAVIADAVEPELRRRAVDTIDEARILDATAVLDDPQTVWHVSAILGRVFVFLQTDAQVASLRGSAQHGRLVAALWELASANDEFGVLARAEFLPVVDSKQNIDENFAGSTYNYFL